MSDSASIAQATSIVDQPGNNESGASSRIAELRIELAQLNAKLQSYVMTSPKHEQPPNFVTDNIDHVVDVFSGDNDYTVDEFLHDFTAAALHFDWCDKQKFIYSKRFIAGTAKLFLRVVKAHSWEDVHHHLLAEFKPTVADAETVRRILLNRHKRIDETNQQYFLAMRKIAATGNVEEADVVNYIVGQITSISATCEKSFFETANSYKTLQVLLRQLDDIGIVDALAQKLDEVSMLKKRLQQEAEKSSLEISTLKKLHQEAEKRSLEIISTLKKQLHPKDIFGRPIVYPSYQ